MVSRPLLLIDVDGVLNVPGRETDPGWETHEVLGPGDRRTWTLVTNPVHGEWLGGLTDLFHLVWCTTWWTVANERIAPLVGLPTPLPAVPLPASFSDVPLNFCAKTPHVRRWAASEHQGRPLAWVDDDIDERDGVALTKDWTGTRSVMGDTPPVPTALTLNADPSVGLAWKHIETLRAWAEGLLLAGAHPQAHTPGMTTTEGDALLAAERARQRMQPASAMVPALDDLVGPDSGVVELPLRIDWSMTNTYDLTDETRLKTMYATVLREAKSVEDLRMLLNEGLLRRVWADLRLPDAVRSRWEQAHPELADPRSR